METFLAKYDVLWNINNCRATIAENQEGEAPYLLYKAYVIIIVVRKGWFNEPSGNLNGPILKR